MQGIPKGLMRPEIVQAVTQQLQQKQRCREISEHIDQAKLRPKKNAILLYRLRQEAWAMLPACLSSSQMYLPTEKTCTSMQERAGRLPDCFSKKSGVN